MANVPNIPSVVVTIEDKSYIQPILQSGRTMLFPFFSKYGKEEITTWSSWDEFESKFGKADPKKFGMGQLYIKGASQFTQSFLGKRLLPDDATYANGVVEFSPVSTNYSSLAGQLDPNGLIATLNDRSFTLYGSGRGDGYNDIVVKFAPLIDYEKYYADEDGIEKYKFNILAATVYERQPNGALVQIEEQPIPFALVDEDPDTHVAIKDIYDGRALSVVDRFEDQSDHVRGFIKDDNKTLENYLGIGDLQSPLLYDAAKGQTLYLTFEDGEIVPNYVSRSSADAADTIRFHWQDETSADRYTVLQVVSGDIILVDDTSNGALPDDVEYIELFSEKAFYKMYLDEKGNFFAVNPVNEYETTAIAGQIKVDTGFDNTGAAVIVNDYVMKETYEYTIDTTNPNIIHFNQPLKYGDHVIVRAADTTSGEPGAKLEPIFFERYNLWRYLINNEFTMENGSSGLNLFIDGRLNFDGPGDQTHQNAKMLLINFYMNNQDIREVLYPAWDFDYVVDFTNDPDVQAAITNLNDYLQTAFGIHCCGISYNYTQDIHYRRYNLGISSFNNALYSGEANTKHYDADMGRVIVMPSAYYAMLSHLYIDGTYGIAEPVANVNKGALRTGTIKLSYSPTSLEIEKLRIKQINAIIDETDGIYFIDQLTMYKKNSILSRIHAVKPIQKIKKDLRKLLKDVLQTKGGPIAVERVKNMTEDYMRRWIYNEQNPRGAFEYYTVAVNFDENALTINVLLTVKPVRTIEHVNVTIIVV